MLYSELAKDLGEKGAIVFSDFEHVILKGIAVCVCFLFSPRNFGFWINLLSFYKILFAFFNNVADRSLTEVFKLFDLIHIVTTDHKIITRITKEVCE